VNPSARAALALPNTFRLIICRGYRVHRLLPTRSSLAHSDDPAKLGAAFTPVNLPPGNKLDKREDDREGQHSIRINDHYRVCFVWKDQDAYEVEVTDYH